MRYTIEIARDQDGLPTTIKINYKTVTLNNDVMTIPANMTKDEIELLKLFYPYTEAATLTINEPLKVETVTDENVILYDDIEDLLKWSSSLGGGHLTKNNTIAYNGSYSLLNTSLDADAGVNQAFRRFPVTKGILDLKCKFYLYDIAQTDYVIFEIAIYDRAGTWYAAIKFNIQTNTMQYYSSGAWHDITNAPLSFMSEAWYECELKINIDSGQYISARINDFIFDVASNVEFTAGPSSPRGEIGLNNFRIAGGNSEVYFDDVQLLGEIS
jgi:hypothetical protein